MDASNRPSVAFHRLYDARRAFDAEQVAGGASAATRAALQEAEQAFDRLFTPPQDGGGGNA
jgi:hypothetical protein